MHSLPQDGIGVPYVHDDRRHLCRPAGRADVGGCRWTSFKAELEFKRKKICHFFYIWKTIERVSLYGGPRVLAGFYFVPFQSTCMNLFFFLMTLSFGCISQTLSRRLSSLSSVTHAWYLIRDTADNLNFDLYLGSSVLTLLY